MPARTDLRMSYPQIIVDGMTDENATFAEVGHLSLNSIKALGGSTFTHVMRCDAGHSSAIIRNLFFRSDVRIENNVAKLVYNGDTCESVVFALKANSHELAIEGYGSGHSRTEAKTVAKAWRYHRTNEHSYLI